MIVPPNKIFIKAFSEIFNWGTATTGTEKSSLRKNNNTESL